MRLGGFVGQKMRLQRTKRAEKIPRSQTGSSGREEGQLGGFCLFICLGLVEMLSKNERQ
jgi:hypothetical protein